MDAMVRRFLLSLCALLVALGLEAQPLTGRVVDSGSGESLPMAHVYYKQLGKGVTTDMGGRFRIERLVGQTLTISLMGYEPYELRITAKTANVLTIKLRENTRALNEIVVKAEKKRYTRKNNPAVELMRRVIAARAQSSLDSHDYYQYTNYRKLSIAINDYKGKNAAGSTERDSTERDSIQVDGVLLKQVDHLQSGLERFDWGEHTEVSPYNGKVVMPVMLDETVTQHVFRRQPRTEKDIVQGKQSSGLNQLLTTGDIFNTIAAEVFEDVNIFDDYVRLLQYPFPSPVGSHAIGFYRFFIQDTVQVEGRQCYHLEFSPNNAQDFGFRGELYIAADSSLQLTRCLLSVPKSSDVNFVENLHIEQTFSQLAGGEWVLSTDDMWAELQLTRLKLLAVRTTRLTDYAFDELPSSLFRGKTATRQVANARNRDEAFWGQYRAVDLTQQESSVGNFMERLKRHKGAKIPLFIIRAVAENYIETGTADRASRFDFGPVMSTISTNFIDGLRLRLGGRTMAALNPHFFWNGYAAYGFRSRQPYYGSTFTYAINRKQVSPFEFPQRNIVFETSYDVMSPSDKFLVNDKDNLLMGLRVQKVRQMYTFNRQRLSFVYETENGLNLTTALKTESNGVAGDLQFIHLDNGQPKPSLRTTEWALSLRYSPGQTYVNTKQKRIPINFDNPEYYLRHTVGFKGLLGGQYRMNQTEIGIYKRQWLGSWGHIDLHLDAAAQWNKLPFPLLMTPPISLSYIFQEGTFNMLNNMEFFMDRKLCWDISWDLNGQLLNRVPLMRKLKWREYIAFKGVWGTLTDKNNPTLDRNAGDAVLFQLPEGSYPIDPHKPYMEVDVGLHNIFHFFFVEWVHRINYHEHPGTKTDGVRFGLQVTF